jgi:sulfate permease, SulP family
MSHSDKFSFKSSYLQSFKPRSFPSSIANGLVLGLIEVFLCISFASLIFRDSLGANLPQGMGFALITSATMLIVIGLTGSQPGTFAVFQDVPAVLLAVIASQMVAVLNPTVVLPTVLTLIAFTSISTGATMVLIGQFKLSGLIRYMPYPVLGGFLAATGWSLISGAFPIMTEEPLTLTGLPVLIQSSQLIRWLPGLVFAVIIFLVIRYARHPLILPGVVFSSLAVYHLVLALTRTSLAQATTLGLFSASQINIFWVPPTLNTYLSADWTVIFQQGGNIAVLIGLSLVGLLLNTSAIELVIEREYDLNHELRSTGLANLLCGIAGGYVGYHMVSNTSMAGRLGIRDRITPLFSGLTCLVMLFFHPPLLNLIPKAMFAGMLLALGFDFMYDWVIIGWKRFSKPEFAVVLLILFVIVMTDYLTGVFIGLLAMIILFAIRYSRVRVILRSYTVGEVFSTVERPEADILLLEKFGSAVQIYELQGFLFFGTANVILDSLKHRLSQLNDPAPFLLLVDFSAVTGIDSSAALSFQKTLHLADEHGIRLVLTGASTQVRARLELDHKGVSSQKMQIMDDLDHGLEWCEDQVLTSKGPTKPVTILATTDRLSTIIPTLIMTGLNEDMATRAVPYFSQVDLAAGDILIRKGDPAGDVYILASGQVSIYQESEKGVTRLRSMGPGSIIGEIAFYLNHFRSANVYVDQPSRVVCMSYTNLEQIREEDPRLSSALQEMLGRQLAIKLWKDERKFTALRR